MIYLDTNFIVPLYTLEATSERVEAFLHDKSPGGLTVSRRAGVEFTSMFMLARTVWTKLQAEDHARVLMRRFDEDMRTALHAYTPSAADFALAATLILEAPASGRRRLHLTAAKHQGTTLYAFEKTLLRAAETLGIPASDAGIGAR